MAQLDMGDCSFQKNSNINSTLSHIQSANSTLSGQGTSNVLNQTSTHPPKTNQNGQSSHGTLSPPNTVQTSNTLNALNNVHSILTAQSNQALSAIDKFYPYRYRDQLNQDGLTELQSKLLEKWRSLKGRTQLDCVRIYLTCTRKWPYFGATLFLVNKTFI